MSGMIRTSTEIMEILKRRWDKSKDRDEWRVLSGRNPRGRYDIFISSPDRVWQLKVEQVDRDKAFGFGLEVGKPDEEMKKLFSHGAPVPFGLISPHTKNNLAIIMAGIQLYSSDSAYSLCRDFVSEKQAELDERLDREIERMKSDPLLRYKYREQKEREERPYL